MVWELISPLVGRWRGLAVSSGEGGTSYLKASWLTYPLSQQPGLGSAGHSHRGG